MKRKSSVAGDVRPKAKLTKLKIEYLRIRDLKPDPRNTRQHSQKQIAQIARSVETFGFNVPVLIDSRSQVIAGHGRVEAAKTLGITEVPTIRLEHLSDGQRRAFMIADNRLTENSTWNERLLGEELKFLSEAELDFSVETTGFEMGEIDLYIQGLEDQTPEPDEADSLPELQNQAVSALGDLWLLDSHRVLCADALMPSSYDRLMDGKQANLVFTDPPYNVKIDGHATGNGKTRHRDFPMASGEMSEKEFESLLTKSLSLAAQHSAPGALQFVCMDWRHMYEVLAAGRTAYSELKNLCVWAKTSGGMGSLYRSQHELIFVFKAGKSSHQNNIQLGRFGRNRTNVWSYPGANVIRGSKSEGALLDVHPTAKPVGLVADAILDCSMRGGLVLDGFLGSGTTVVAAERTGRNCYGLELDPLYVDVIVRRWEKFSGKQATHADTGLTFQETQKVIHG